MKKYLRNTLKEGMSDTFDIMLGNHGYSTLDDGKPVKFTFGATDLLLFPLLSKALINYGFPTKPSRNGQRIVKDEEKNTLFRNTIGFIGAVFQPFRFAAAACLNFTGNTSCVPGSPYKVSFCKIL